jgi:AraC-like DNA-binding protein
LDELKGKKINDLMSATLELMLNSYFSGKIEVKALLPSQFPELVERTIEFITRHNEEDPTGKFNLTELSRSVHSSPENLCRLFQKTLHLGPLEYVKMLRLDRAANLLRRSSQSLKEVAAQTGFYDSFHLSKSFKKVYGLSPKDFKASPFNEWICQKNPIIRTLYSRSDLKALSASARSGKS